jgi:pimeloyl-ACP methyl ester carboxylesterase
MDGYADDLAAAIEALDLREATLVGHSTGGGEVARYPTSPRTSRKFDIPTLVLHGEDDQIVPVKDSAKKSARLIKGAKEIYYPGAPHGLTATHQDQVNADLLAFVKA